MIAEEVGSRINAAGDLIAGSVNSLVDIVDHGFKGVRSLCRYGIGRGVLYHVKGVAESIASVVLGLILLIPVLFVPSLGVHYIPFQRW